MKLLHRPSSNACEHATLGKCSFKQDRRESTNPSETFPVNGSEPEVLFPRSEGAQAVAKKAYKEIICAGGGYESSEPLMLDKNFQPG